MMRRTISHHRPMAGQYKKAPAAGLVPNLGNVREDEYARLVAANGGLLHAADRTVAQDIADEAETFAMAAFYR